MKRITILGFCVAAVALLQVPQREGQAAQYRDWADKYSVGHNALDWYGPTSWSSSCHTVFNGGSGSQWSDIGVQTDEGRANAVTIQGLYLRDRTTGNCGNMTGQMYRYRRGSSGRDNALGDTCPPDLQSWDADGYAYRDQDTCDWNGSVDYWHTSRNLEIDHSNADDYLSGSGWKDWEYVTTHYVWLNYPYSDYWDCKNCFALAWYV